MPPDGRAETPQKVDSVLALGFPRDCLLYSMDINGNAQGYLTGYLDRLTSLGGQRFFLFFDEPEALLTKLHAGELDAVGGILSPRNLGQDLIPSTEPYGMSQQVLYAPSGNKTLHYEDFSAFSGLKVGVVRGRWGVPLLEAFAQKNHIAFETVFFTDSLDMRQALEKGAVDAVVSDLHDEHFSRIIASLGTIPLRFYTLAGRRSVMERLDCLQSMLHAVDPYYRASLEFHYFGQSRKKNYAQTRDESLFVEQLPKLTVVCGPDNPPAFYYDKQARAYRGSYMDLLHLITKYSGLRFSIVQANSHAECLEMLHSHRADLYMGMYWVDSFALVQGLQATEPFTQIHMLIAGKQGTQVNRYIAQNVAVTFERPSMPYYVQERFPNWNLRYYNSIAESMEAVNKGICDVSIQPEDAIFDLLARNPYPDIGIISSVNSEVSVVLAMREAENPLLLSVLNKAITSIDDSEYSSIAVRNEIMPIEFSRFWRLNQGVIEVWIALAVLGVVGLFSFFQYRIYSVAYRDRLTHLYNQNYFFDKTVKSKSVQKMPQKAVVVIEIANLRQINEYYGEETGNRVLVRIASLLKKCISSGTLLYRLTGDSFLFITSYSERSVFEAFVDYLRNHMKNYKDGLISTQLNFNIGVSLSGKDVKISEAVDRAERGRRKAKDSVNAVVFFNTEMEDSLRAATKVEKSMESALANGEFLVYYQPKFDLRDRRFIGAEALVRWQMASGDFLRPDEFIPIFEQNGFIVKVDFHVLETVCALLRKQIDLGYRPFPVSVNQSRVHMNDPEYLAKLREVMERYRLPSHLVELELTEYSFMEGDKIAALLNQMKALGLSLSIDDFGSGYSSLTLLRELPINVLKIDKSFLAESSTSEKNRTIIRHIVHMSHDLCIENVCEGIETDEQADFLKNIGCRYGQGFLFSRPLPQAVYLRTYYGIEELS